MRAEQEIYRGEHVVYRYAVHFLNEQVAVNSCMQPEQFLELVNELHDLFSLGNFSGYEVWQEDGIWIPLHGVQEQSNAVLLPEVISDMPVKQNNNYDLGSILFKHYASQKKEERTIKSYFSRRSTDPARLELLQSKIRVVDRAFYELATEKWAQDIPVLDLVRMFTDNDYAIEAIVEETHISRATLFRHKRTIQEELGRWAVQNLTHNELNWLLEEN